MADLSKIERRPWRGLCTKGTGSVPVWDLWRFYSAGYQMSYVGVYYATGGNSGLGKCNYLVRASYKARTYKSL